MKQILSLFFVFQMITLSALEQEEQQRLVNLYDEHKDEVIQEPEDRSILQEEHSRSRWETVKTVALCISAMDIVIRGAVGVKKRYTEEIVLTPATMKQEIESLKVSAEWQQMVTRLLTRYGERLDALERTE